MTRAPTGDRARRGTRGRDHPTKPPKPPRRVSSVTGPPLGSDVRGPHHRGQPPGSPRTWPAGTGATDFPRAWGARACLRSVAVAFSAIEELASFSLEAPAAYQSSISPIATSSGTEVVACKTTLVQWLQLRATSGERLPDRALTQPMRFVTTPA